MEFSYVFTAYILQDRSKHKENHLRRDLKKDAVLSHPVMLTWLTLMRGRAVDITRNTGSSRIISPDTSTVIAIDATSKKFSFSRDKKISSLYFAAILLANSVSSLSNA